MERIPLASSVVASVGYEPQSHTLELEFTSGRVYQYQAVPRGTFEWLLRANSKGGFFTRMIQDRYAYCDVTPGLDGGQVDLSEALRASLRAVARDRS
jgi:KTSC domain